MQLWVQLCLLFFVVLCFIRLSFFKNLRLAGWWIKILSLVHLELLHHLELVLHLLLQLLLLFDQENWVDHLAGLQQGIFNFDDLHDLLEFVASILRGFDAHCRIIGKLVDSKHLVGCLKQILWLNFFSLGFSENLFVQLPVLLVLVRQTEGRTFIDFFNDELSKRIYRCH